MNFDNPQSTDVQVCRQCKDVHVKGLEICPKCFLDLKGLKPYKRVRTAGMVFTVMSSRERATTLDGRHFFCIGRDCAGWTLFEHNQSLAMHGTAHCIGRKFERLADTEDLVAEIRRLVEAGEKLPTDRRPPWEICEARHRESQAIVANRREQKMLDAAAAKQAKEDAKCERWLKKEGLVHCSRCLVVHRIIENCPSCGTPSNY